MKNKLRRFESFPFYDHTGIENHLEKMSAKGWLIERISPFGWIYRRMEPQKLQFSVNYYPWTSEYEPKPSEDQQTLLDFCAYTGWQFACSWSSMQIFYSDHPEPIPIDTDAAIQVENIYNGSKRSFISANVMLILLAVLVAVVLRNSTDSLITLLSRPSNLVILSLGLIQIMMSLTDLSVFYIWYVRAVKAAKCGEFLPTKGTAPVHKAASILVGLILLLWLAGMFADKFHGRSIIYILCIFACVLIIVLINALREFFKRQNLSAAANMTLTTLTAFFIYLLVFGSIVYVLYAGMKVDTDFSLKEGRQLSSDQLVLTMDDLTDRDPKFNDAWGTVEESLLLKKETVYLSSNAGESQTLNAKYMIVTVKAPWLYTICKNDLLDRAAGTIYGTQLQGTKGYMPIEQPPEGASEAYRLQDGEEKALHTYLLCCGNRLIQVGFSWEPSPQILDVAFEKLMNQ